MPLLEQRIVGSAQHRYGRCGAAVEGSERMAEHARSIVAENRLDSASGGPITVVASRMEDVDSLPVPQV